MMADEQMELVEYIERMKKSGRTGEQIVAVASQTRYKARQSEIRKLLTEQGLLYEHGEVSLETVGRDAIPPVQDSQVKSSPTVALSVKSAIVGVSPENGSAAVPEQTPRLESHAELPATTSEEAMNEKIRNFVNTILAKYGVESPEAITTDERREVKLRRRAESNGTDAFELSDAEKAYIARLLKSPEGTDGSGLIDAFGVESAKAPAGKPEGKAPAGKPAKAAAPKPAPKGKPAPKAKPEKAPAKVVKATTKTKVKASPKAKTEKSDGFKKGSGTALFAKLMLDAKSIEKNALLDAMIAAGMKKSGARNYITWAKNKPGVQGKFGLKNPFPFQIEEVTTLRVIEGSAIEPKAHKAPAKKATPKAKPKAPAKKAVKKTTKVKPSPKAKAKAKPKKK